MHWRFRLGSVALDNPWEFLSKGVMEIDQNVK